MPNPEKMPKCPAQERTQRTKDSIATNPPTTGKHSAFLARENIQPVPCDKKEKTIIYCNARETFNRCQVREKFVSKRGKTFNRFPALESNQVMSCAKKEFNLFPSAGNFQLVIHARKGNSTCFQARENFQPGSSAGKQLSGEMTGKNSTCIHMQAQETSKLGSCQKHCRNSSPGGFLMLMICLNILPRFAPFGCFPALEMLACFPALY